MSEAPLTGEIVVGDLAGLPVMMAYSAETVPGRTVLKGRWPFRRRVPALEHGAGWYVALLRSARRYERHPGYPDPIQPRQWLSLRH